MNDLKATLNSVARIAVDHNVPLEDLIVMLRESYEGAKKKKKKPLEPVGVGCFVLYFDPKKGPLTAHVLEVRGADQLKLSVHCGTARPNEIVDYVPYSIELKKKHWSRRQGSGFGGKK